MPLYFFHLRNGADLLLDEEGRNLEGLAEVAIIAMLEARSLMSQDVLNGQIGLDQRFDVEDEQHNLVYSLPFDAAVTITSPRAPI